MTPRPDADRLLSLISEILRIPPQSVADALDMAQTETWDSLTHMELIAGLEQDFGIELTSDEIIMMTSIGSIKDVLRSHGLAI